VIVPWAGAVGGAANAIRGLVANWPKYAEDQPSGKSEAHRLRWNTGAIVQPALGSVYGLIAVLIVTLILGTLGSSNTLDVTAGGQMLLTAVSFVVGYRQKTFHDLVTRSVKVLFGPDDAVADNDEGGAGTASIKLQPIPRRSRLSRCPPKLEAATKPRSLSTLIQRRAPAFSRQPCA
jgi:hypothetical protein